MDFSEAHDAFFTPRENARPVPSDSPARRLRDALEPLAMVDIWSDAAAQHGRSLGLDFLGWYVGGRGGLLGDPHGAVVAATFGVFEPGFVAATWDAARSNCTLKALRGGHVQAAAEALGASLDGVSGDEVATVVGPLRAAIDGSDVSGRPLFAGLRALGWPDDPKAQLWHAASALREHRGDAHLGACNAAGLGGLEANVLTELWVGYELLEYTGTRAWPQEAMDAAVARLERGGLLYDGAMTDDGRRLRDEVEVATDRAEQAVVEALGDQLETIVRTAGGWSEKVLASGWFPPDPYKRFAG